MDVCDDGEPAFDNIACTARVFNQSITVYFWSIYSDPRSDCERLAVNLNETQIKTSDIRLMSI